MKLAFAMRSVVCSLVLGTLLGLMPVQGVSAQPCYACLWWPGAACISTGFFQGSTDCIVVHGPQGSECQLTGYFCVPMASHDALDGYGWIVAAQADGFGQGGDEGESVSKRLNGLTVRRRVCDRGIVGARVDVAASEEVRKATRSIVL